MKNLLIVLVIILTAMMMLVSGCSKKKNKVVEPEGPVVFTVNIDGTTIDDDGFYAVDLDETNTLAFNIDLPEGWELVDVASSDDAIADVDGFDADGNVGLDLFDIGSTFITLTVYNEELDKTETFTFELEVFDSSIPV